MKDDLQVFLVVYFQGGNTGWYKTNYKMSKWCFEQYARWAANPKEVHGIITLSCGDDPTQGPHFFRCDLVSGFNTSLIDEEEEFLRKEQIKEQVKALKKLGKCADDAMRGEDWRE